MVAHLSKSEQDLANRIAGRRKQGGITKAHLVINAARRRRGEEEIQRGVVYRHVSGRSHMRSQRETRGRPKTLTSSQIARLQAARRRLIKTADSESRILYYSYVLLKCV